MHLRSAGPLPHPQPSPSDGSDEPPASKRRKTGPQPKYLCFACDVERVGSQFPDVNPSGECEHLINTCKKCLRQWVQVAVEGGGFVMGVRVGKVGNGKEKGEEEGEEGWEETGEDVKVEVSGSGEDGKVKRVGGEERSGLVFGIKCPHPGCEAVMRGEDVEVAGTQKVFARFEEMERKFIAENTPGWRWCLGTHCKAGQVHVPPASGESSPELVVNEHKTLIFASLVDALGHGPPPNGQNTDICTCHVCGTRACVSCDRPWHEGETCVAYQERVKGRFEEEDQSFRVIQKVSRPCPGCGRRVQKNGGCRFMHCTQCRYDFCWECMSVVEGYGGSCKCG
ncbi:hypothetical protein BAUCODRAFT_36491 [Baudoinia panamericana UAMH 10762]|uniref:RBR-type E3 ubiquitin transferase n=1 Tax=Baudoinia panamericana (strain UAMH 10762) TaxID=717646 RepID=M2N5J8_BAUPA|nr:uncharacterized protein BAUCODRAFT_36491 [Baudoinia panamericana UAMH 10762]EMC94020.1 hypothetical protein BAUCODRAFT_36491 [Baudoinia panamericana UAMH 10762]